MEAPGLEALHEAVRDDQMEAFPCLHAAAFLEDPRVEAFLEVRAPSTHAEAFLEEVQAVILQADPCLVGLQEVPCLEAFPPELE